MDFDDNSLYRYRSYSLSCYHGKCQQLFIFFSLQSPQYIVVFPYKAQQEDELSFPAEATFEILDLTNNSGWFKARLGKKIGLIPSTYVQPSDAHHHCK